MLSENITVAHKLCLIPFFIHHGGAIPAIDSYYSSDQSGRATCGDRVWMGGRHQPTPAYRGHG